MLILLLQLILYYYYYYSSSPKELVQLPLLSLHSARWPRTLRPPGLRLAAGGAARRSATVRTKGGTMGLEMGFIWKNAGVSLW